MIKASACATLPAQWQSRSSSSSVSLALALRGIDPLTTTHTKSVSSPPRSSLSSLLSSLGSRFVELPDSQPRLPSDGMKAFANKLKRNKTNEKVNNTTESIVSEPLGLGKTTSQTAYQETLAQTLPKHFASPQLSVHSNASAGQSASYLQFHA